MKELQQEIFDVIPDLIDYSSKIDVREQVKNEKNSFCGKLPRSKNAFDRIKAEKSSLEPDRKVRKTPHSDFHN